MIDFHSHILPNVDDGSKSLEETIKLIEEAKSAGFKAIISTSHFVRGYFETTVKERKELLHSISKTLEENKVDVELYLGNEIYFSEDIVKLIEEKTICSINNTKYILFELPLSSKPINLYNVIYDLMQNNFIPVLAHPERYSFVQQNPKLVEDLIEKGVLIQSNFGSFIGEYGKKAQIIVKKLLKNNMVHFLGSDTHRKGTIYPKIPKILKRMEKLIGNEKLKQLTEVNPSLVLKNELIEVEDITEIKLSTIEKINLKI